MKVADRNQHDTANQDSGFRTAGPRTFVLRVLERIREHSRFGVLAVVGMVLSLLVLAPFALLAGVSVTEAYHVLFVASVGELSGIATTLRMTTPLLLVGVGVALPYRAGLFNIGGEGQLLVGAATGAIVAISFPSMAGIPGSFIFPALAAMLAGGLWGGVAGALRGWRGINEIIGTIMLNFVGIYVVQYLVSVPFQDPELAYSATERIAPGYQLAALSTPMRVHAGLLVALGVTVGVGWFFSRTRLGFRVTLVGENAALAARQGLSPGKYYFGALAAGGALAGLGGAMELLGNQYRVGQGFSPGWGFDAIAVALLARGRMSAIVPVAIFFAALRNGAGVLGRTVDIPGSIVLILQSVPVLVVAGLVGAASYRRLSNSSAAGGGS